MMILRDWKMTFLSVRNKYKIKMNINLAQHPVTAIAKISVAGNC